MCLPVEGVTAENALTCSTLLSSKLANKTWTHSGRPQGVTVVRNAYQWYLTFYMGHEVALSDVQSALKGSAFSVPQDKLRLFGHAILEIDTRSVPQQALLTDLKAVKHVAIEKSKTQDDLLLVTLDMPYPVETERSDRETVGWEKFRRNDLSFDQAGRSDGPIGPVTLPSYATLRDIVVKHDARLKDIRWSQNYGCRAMGAVTAPAEKTQSPDATVTKQ